MKTGKYFFIFLTIVGVLSLPVAVAQSVKRYAIVVGANDGGEGRVTLRYAQSDARAVADVFHELGGLALADRYLLLEPGVADIQRAFASLQTKVREDRRHFSRTEILFYYSGHSDEKGLLLGKERMTYSGLREVLKTVESDVQLAVLDSCASGAFTRLKGGSRKPPFLMDESSKVKGHAFLTSSSADEAAQESDSIGGSFFTHYFVSALRGAADSTRDRRVTLNEAYQFAFHETLALTEQTLSGAQHAAYDIQLAGAGDLVLTDLRASHSVLDFAPELQGRIFVRNEAGSLIAEMNKQQAKAVQLSVPPDLYVITLETRDGLFRIERRLADRSVLMINEQGFVPVTRVATVARGGEAVASYQASDYVDVSLRVGILPDLAIRSNEPGSKKENARVDLNLFAGNVDRVSQASIGYFMSWVKEDMVGGQGAGILALTGEDVIGGSGAGVASIVQGNVMGGQGAGVAAISNGNVKGGQGAGVTAIVRGNMDGGQGAGVAAITGGNIRGGQGAGVVSVAGGTVSGGQGAGIMTFGRGNIAGGQGSGVMNIAAADVDGVQGTSVLNVARGTVSGGQFGLINIAGKNQGFAFGAINIAGNGRLSPGLSLNEAGFPSVYLKSGVGRLYNRISIGGIESPDQVYMRLAWGAGLHFQPHKRFGLDVDLDYARLASVETGVEPQTSEPLPKFTPEQYYSFGVSAMIGVFPNVYLAVRPALHLAYGTGNNGLPRGIYRDAFQGYRAAPDSVVWPGLSVAVEYQFH